MSVALPTKPDWGELGPAMRALPNDRWRAFVEFYLLETTANGAKNNYGAQANAARKARFGEPKTTARVGTPPGRARDLPVPNLRCFHCPQDEVTVRRHRRSGSLFAI
jgi:hypothetical protein